MTTCKNCGHQFELAYCNKCGQKASVKRIEMKWLIHDLPHAIWHIDKGFLFNVIQLTKRPGYAVAEYIEGKRKFFFHPISFLLILLAGMYLVTHYLQVSWYKPDEAEWMNPWANTFWREYHLSQRNWTKSYLEYMFIYMPPASLLFWRILRWLKRNYNYAESLVALIFFLSYCVIPQLIVFFVMGLVNNTNFSRIADTVVTIFVGGLIAYQVYQLGDTGVSKRRRYWAGIIVAFLLILWLYIVLFIQTELMHRGILTESD
jgi:hypothetical protein